MFNESVRGFLKKYSDGAIVSHTVNIIGMGESSVAEEIEDMFDAKNPTVAPYAKRRGAAEDNREGGNRRRGGQNVRACS